MQEQVLELKLQALTTRAFQLERLDGVCHGIYFHDREEVSIVLIARERANVTSSVVGSKPRQTMLFIGCQIVCVSGGSSGLKNTKNIERTHDLSWFGLSGPYV